MAFAACNSGFSLNPTLLVRSPLPSAAMLQQFQKLNTDGVIETTISGVRSLRAAHLQMIAAVTARGLLTIATAAVTLAVVGGLVLLLAAASLGPARQARRAQPAPLLREE